MAAGISLMYKMSGGCDHKHRCGECILFAEDGKRYFCQGHPFGGEHWKPDLIACKSFRSSEKHLLIEESENGQYEMFME